MTQSALHSVPRPRDVLLEQVRGVGRALQRPAAAAAVLAGLVTLLFTIENLRGGAAMDFNHEYWLLPGLAGFLLPIGVWKGEERFGAGFLWTLPVDRRYHALAKVAAGWVWLMGAVALFVLWLLGLALLSGGSILPEETLQLLPSSSIPAPGTLDPRAVETVRWTPHPLLWLVPFTAATATYLLASALALGATLRWIIGTALGVFLLMVLVGGVGEVANSEWLIFAPSRLLRTLLFGSYGFDTLVTARTGFLRVPTTLSTGETVMVWRALPDLGQWATATLLWVGVGLIATWAAASRHRERRRP